MLTAPEIYGIVTVEGNIFLPLKTNRLQRPERGGKARLGEGKQ